MQSGRVKPSDSPFFPYRLSEIIQPLRSFLLGSPPPLLILFHFLYTDGCSTHFFSPPYPLARALSFFEFRTFVSIILSLDRLGLVIRLPGVNHALNAISLFGTISRRKEFFTLPTIGHIPFLL
jgi:hypothetical protein